MGTYRVTSGLFASIAVDALWRPSALLPIATIAYAAGFAVGMLMSMVKAKQARRNGDSCLTERVNVDGALRISV